ncbi:MAG: hypothetical protein QM728_10085 [Gordonia sp. (in: high G+C Gram-positive bacteria)]|uniref:hypothetical protein n=1 Tax=Gordonia sp. (in: high G+C Gram-positive bacteria) TaxID=84139 RepID=UPI0039E6B8E5
MARASSGRSRRAPSRSYGVTPWGAAFLRAFAAADSRRMSKARSYFRDRHVHGLTVDGGRITSSVSGSQLDPFEVTIELRTVDAPTVVGLLRAAGRLGDLTDVARGGQPVGLLEFVAPTEAADAVAGCTCPIDDRCIHVLATAYEVAAQIDHDPSVLLAVMGAPLAELLALANGTPEPDAPDRGHVVDAGRVVDDDFYGDRAALPDAPTLTDFHAFTEFEAPLLRQALRATGIAALDVAEAADELAAMYEHLGGRSRGVGT